MVKLFFTFPELESFDKGAEAPSFAEVSEVPDRPELPDLAYLLVF